MNNELLKMDIQKINLIPAQIEFAEFEQLKAQALELAEYIQQVEVNEENIKTSKKLLAAVNKRVKEIDDKRIAIKKAILLPYESFDLKVKEIVTIVKNADATVREQIHELDEIERDIKRNAIHDIFDKRIVQYPFKDTFEFEDFLKPQHLNKSVTMKSIESDMVEWLEKIDADLSVMKSLPNYEQILTEYYDTKDLTVAIRIVNEFNERKQKVESLITPTKKAATYHVITLHDDKDLLAVEMFMQLKEIKYSIEKVEN